MRGENTGKKHEIVEFNQYRVVVVVVSFFHCFQAFCLENENQVEMIGINRHITLLGRSIYSTLDIALLLFSVKQELVNEMKKKHL